MIFQHGIKIFTEIDIAEILLKVALTTKHEIKINQSSFIIAPVQ
jgi:uncharacterized protein (DUF302 family)